MARTSREPDDGEPDDGEPDDGEPDDGEPDDGEPDGTLLTARQFRALRGWNYLWITGALIVGILMVSAALIESARSYSTYDLDELLLPNDTFLAGEFDAKRHRTRQETETLCVMALCGCLMFGLAAYGIALASGRKVTLRWLMAGVLATGVVSSVPAMLQEDPRGLRSRMVLVPQVNLDAAQEQSVLDALQEEAALYALGGLEKELNPAGERCFAYLRVRLIESKSLVDERSTWNFECVFEPGGALSWENRRALCDFYKQYAVLTVQKASRACGWIDPALLRPSAHGRWAVLRVEWEDRLRIAHDGSVSVVHEARHYTLNP